jgi:hypothetical protein
MSNGKSSSCHNNLLEVDNAMKTNTGLVFYNLGCQLRMIACSSTLNSRQLSVHVLCTIDRCTSKPSQAQRHVKTRTHTTTDTTTANTQQQHTTHRKHSRTPSTQHTTATHSHTQSHPPTHTHSLTHTESHTVSHSLTQSHTHKFRITPTHTRIRTRIPWGC